MGGPKPAALKRIEDPSTVDYRKMDLNSDGRTTRAEVATYYAMRAEERTDDEYARLEETEKAGGGSWLFGFFSIIWSLLRFFVICFIFSALFALLTHKVCETQLWAVDLCEPYRVVKAGFSQCPATEMHHLWHTSFYHSCAASVIRISDADLSFVVQRVPCASNAVWQQIKHGAQYAWRYTQEAALQVKQSWNQKMESL